MGLVCMALRSYTLKFKGKFGGVYKRSVMRRGLQYTFRVTSENLVKT